ncbi:hypothetical protein INQ40_12315 [Lysobacter sp. H21R4]|uniref:hypothetical protein n=1 Tax=Lysobacter sp. H21R4 TaxID=2781021 RepID=UPI0018882FC5|nr:hypothetical protein [Lysobacter sp. H21R4]QOY62636.1 hypothetical protein INQ40_12315 [Lysobacter sp. H21R4]
MFRKILLPALAIGLLGGCVSSGYQYDSGGYYYGQPSTTYRYHDSYYDNYRYPGYYGSLNYRYGYPGYRYPGYGYPGYGYGGGYYRPPVVIVRPGHGNHHGGNHDYRPPTGGRNDRAPWRDYERLQRERIQRSTPPAGNRPSSAVMRNPVPAQPRPAAMPSRPAAPTPSQGSRNSRSDRMIERARASREVE